MRAAIAYARTRMGDIAFAVRTDHRYYGYRPDHVEWSASVVKAMLMVAYLDEPSVARRNLDSADHALLGPMITGPTTTRPRRCARSWATARSRRSRAASG